MATNVGAAALMSMAASAMDTDSNTAVDDMMDGAAASSANSSSVSGMMQTDKSQVPAAEMVPLTSVKPFVFY